MGKGFHKRRLFTANVYDDGRKRLQGRLQTFAGTVANVCGNGCNALRLRRAKLAPKSPVLFWIREYLQPSLHGLAGKILLEGYL